MATMEVHFFSESLMRNVTFNAIIPVDKRSIDGNKARTKNEPMKSLYMLPASTLPKVSTITTHMTMQE